MPGICAIQSPKPVRNKSILTNSKQHVPKAAALPREASESAVANNAPHGSYASITNAPNPPNPIFPSCAVIPAVKPRAMFVPVLVQIVKQACSAAQKPAHAPFPPNNAPFPPNNASIPPEMPSNRHASHPAAQPQAGYASATASDATKA